MTCHRCGRKDCRELGSTPSGTWWECTYAGCRFVFLAKAITPTVKEVNESILKQHAERWLRQA